MTRKDVLATTTAMRGSLFWAAPTGYAASPDPPPRAEHCPYCKGKSIVSQPENGGHGAYLERHGCVEHHSWVVRR